MKNGWKSMILYIKYWLCSMNVCLGVKWNSLNFDYAFMRNWKLQKCGYNTMDIICKAKYLS